GRVLEADDFGHLQVEVAIDEVVVEYTSGLKEVAVLVEITERLAQRAAHGGDLLELSGRQIVEVLVDRRARIELVLDAVEPGHQHRGKTEIRIGERIREADLDAAAIRRRGEGNTARRGAVAHRIGQQHRRLEAG